MNGKKAKKLRQLTRLLQDKGIVDKEWKVSGSIEHEKAMVYDFAGKDTTKFIDVSNVPKPVMIKQSMLKAECGQAVYKAMKKRAML